MADKTTNPNTTAEGEAEPWSLTRFMGELPLAGKNGILIAAIAAVFVLAAIIWFAARPSYKLLYSGMPEAEAAHLVEQLDKMKVPYELADGGKTVRIPADRLTQVRLELASLGIPKTNNGVGYEIFDKTSLGGLTDFMNHVNYQRALQGELARTIESLSAVKSARVHIVLPKRSMFVSEERKATASITVELNQPLNATQTEGIVHLVASAVEGLDKNNITVLDQKGNLLAGGREESQDGRMAPDRSLSLQWEKEKALEKRVQTMLDRILGADKSIVRVTVDLDLARVEKQEESFDPEGQVTRSEEVVNEQSAGVFGSGGTPGVQPNDPNNTNTAGGGAGSQQNRNVERERVNYEISRTVKRTQEPVGGVKRMSVAVVVDGTYSPGEKPKDPPVYRPRDEKELAKLKRLIEETVGLRADRGDTIQVTNTAFEPIKVQDNEANPWLNPEFQLEMAKYAVFGLLIFLLVFFVIRPLLKTLLLPEKLDEDALPGTVADLERRLMLEGVGSLPSDQPVRVIIPDRTMQLAQQMIAEHQEEARDILRSWLTEE
ncbi:MAG: flagellar M-ring protein FliF [Magnetococcales bacterium]|nr:flagellar M-ring protein FliF [Magnetococcales bacterium]